MKPTTFRFLGILTLGLVWRLLPFRPPNVEPILASQMPFAKQGGALTGFLFGVFSILLYDLVTGTVGPWTLLTASAYGALGLGAAWYLRNRAGKRYFVYYAVIGTLFYDAATGLTVGPLFFNQPFVAAVLGQIPFTLMHLGGNVGFALTLSPLIEGWVARKSETDTRALSLQKQEIKSSGFQFPRLLPAEGGQALE